MLQPKRTKHRKMFRIRHDKVKAARNNTVTFGEYGLKSTSSAWISAKQIEAARIAITRYMGRAVVKEGTVMFETMGNTEEVMKEALRLGGHKLPVTWKIVKREEPKEEVKGDK